MLLPVVSAFLCLVEFASATATTQIGGTTITGTTYPHAGVDFFGGIPFAEAPVGNLRFQPPVLKTSLTGSKFNATNFGPACLQTDLPPGALLSEDCLQLNIFRPAGTPAGKNLPIMFWIYGGGFTTGLASMYNATGLVQKSVERGTPIIVVSINYRLGPLGFPQGGEAEFKKLLNLGLRDQVAGLEWVQKNIGQFGGDKTKVTIFGESAGATAVFTLAMGSKIKGLARAAIAESTGFLPTFGPQRNEAIWQSFVGAVPGCASAANTMDTISCLQKANTSDILTGLNVIIPPTSGTSVVSFFPNIDGPGGFLPDVVSNLKPESQLPMIMGNNLDEGALFTPQTAISDNEIRNQLTIYSKPSLEANSTAFLDHSVGEILALYPNVAALGSPFNTGNDTFGLHREFKRFAAIYGDFVFQAGRRKYSASLSQQGVKVYGYQFTDPSAIVPFPGVAPGSLGTTHMSEIPYLFSPPLNQTKSALALSSTMQDYWISFAVTLNPNDNKGNKRPEWAQYTPTNSKILQLDARGIKNIPDNYRQQQMEFIANHTVNFHF